MLLNMAAPIRLIVCMFCVCTFSVVFSFNLEPRIPIVKKGSAHSHFGYTVAQHQSVGPGATVPLSWMLVGAPKDQNLQPGTNRSGALWKCPISTKTTDCEQVQTDGFRNPETGLYDFDYSGESLTEPSEDEIKDDQWLGVTLKSQKPGGKILVCAHRYMHKGKGFQWGFGLCYILSHQFEVVDYLEPCRGKPVNEGHQQFGFCQAGTSGLLLDDEAVLGVPGPYTWRGTVHTSNISDDFLLKDKTQYFGPVTENDSPVDKYSYLGYSVTAGRFFGNYMSYVGGAPRANGTGEVVFFTREKIGVSLLRVDLILNGEMFASSYGFEVLALDINGDRRDDLIVSAPFYYTSTSSGAVYVYMNNDGGFVHNHPYTKIEGAPGESRFGFSMTSLGDLNRDGFLDVAIGAPYEGRGAIYIFLGSSNGLIKEPVQVIHAEDMPGKPYDAFGYALSGGMDLDNNGYPDLLTSSFCSDRVLLIRARPIIDIQTQVQSKGQLQNIDPSKKGCAEDVFAHETCFSFSACFKMDNNAGTRTGLRIKYTIEERVYKDQPIARIRFDNGLSDQPSVVERDINLRPEDMGRFQCSREIVYLLDSSRDILRPLRFKLSYEIIQREPRPVAEGDPIPNIDDYPILNQQEALRYFEGTFAKDCGDDDVCVSDLNVIGSIGLERHEKRDHYLLRLGEQDDIPLNIEVTNAGEPAYQSVLRVTHHKALAFNLKESQVGSYQCSTTSNTVVQCGIGNPLTGTTGPLVLSFRESGHPFDSRFILFTVAADSSSTEKTPQDPLQFHVEVIKKAEISIIGSVTPEQAFYGGEVTGESAIKQLDEIGMEVSHKYVIDNRGPWRVDELQVEVLWPHQVENNKEQGKWLLYMTENPIVEGVGECEIDQKFINPLILRRDISITDAQTGLDVEGEIDPSHYPGPDSQGPGEPGESGGTGAGVGGVKITKTTTKKVTNTTTIKKKTSKSTSEKELSLTTEKTSSSHGFSSGTSSSSSFSSSSSSSSSSNLDTSVDQEGSGFDQTSGRESGRIHSRINRRAYFSSDKSRFNEGDRKYDLNTDGEGDSFHEETRTSSRTSPDGRTKFYETHHESSRTTVKEEKTEEDIPRGRWSDRGGYRQVHVGTSSSGFRTSDGIPEDGHSQWDNQNTSHSGEGAHYDADRGANIGDLEGSSSSDRYDRKGQGWQVHDSNRRVESVSRRTHSGGYGGAEDDSYRRVYSEDRRITDGNSRTQTAGYDRIPDSDGSRLNIYGGSREIGGDRTGSGRGEQNWRVDGTHRIDSINREESTKRIGEDSSTRIHTHESRGGFGRDNARNFDYDSFDRRKASSGAQRTFTDTDFRSTDHHRSRTPGSGFNRDIEDDTLITHSWEYDRATVGGRTSHGHSRKLEDGERTFHGSDSDLDGGRTFLEHDINLEDGGRTFHGHDRNLENDGNTRTITGTNDRTGAEGHHSYSHDYERSHLASTNPTTNIRKHDRNGQHSLTDGHAGTSRSAFDWDHRGAGTVGHHGYSHDNQNRHIQHGHVRSSEDGHVRSSEDGYRTHDEDSRIRHGSNVDLRTDSGNLKTTTWELNSGSRQDNPRWNTYSSRTQGSSDNWNKPHDHRNITGGFGARGFNHFEESGPDENGTYTRVEVDPETGKTTVYTRRVYTSGWPENWEHRSYSGEVSSVSSQNEDKLLRNKRELRRIKREKELIIKPQAVTDAQTGKTMQVVNLRCDGDVPTAKCFVFRCNIRNLGAKQSASIRIKSRLWNSTLVEDYPRVSYVSIKSKASLILPEDIRKDQDQSDDVASAETLAYPDLLDQLPPEEVPLWVILVSIFAGLLVLILIVLILWKLGFFERKRPDPTLSGNLDKDANGY
ncbi:hypothetical protein OTU49_002915 [Cherax quadricarinatus]|uniref:Uncharacterized protein n=1 Tax=Cherax quadricarinatus TaxID=27406 RepID=A0AAW0X7W0_CHEQU